MTCLVINQGNGKVPRGTKKASEANIKQFIRDLDASPSYEFLQELEDGRHRYRLLFQNKIHILDMPALSLNRVRYTGQAGQKTFDFYCLPPTSILFGFACKYSIISWRG